MNTSYINNRTTILLTLLAIDVLLCPAVYAEDVAISPEIVVTARRTVGSVIGDIAPQTTLTSVDLQALGASTMSEVIALLSAQTRSGQGRGGEAPVVLLNGRRIANFSEVRDLPPEAVARVEVLAEEVALKYGYLANQRVVNIVLADRFNAMTGELEPRFTTGTRRNDFNTEFGLVQIDKKGRFTLDMQYQTAQALTESQRGITTVDGAFQTLLPQTQQFSANAVFSRPLFAGVNATANGRLDIYDSKAGIGTNAGTPLSQYRRNITSHAGVTLGGDIARWRWSLTSGYDRIEGHVRTDTNLASPDMAVSTATTGTADLTAGGTLFVLPAGPVGASILLDAQTIRFNSETQRAGTRTIGRAARDVTAAAATIDLPIASRREGFLGGLGELSLNGNVRIDRLSDVRTLTTRGYGISWKPLEPISLLMSVTDDEGAPTPQQLSNPLIFTPGITLFDYVRGEAVRVTRIDGGNPALLVDARHVFKAEANVKPFAKMDLSLTASYVSSQLRNQASNFPAITPVIEAAFPGRVTRDATGRIVQVDSRPVNFAREDRSELRWGVNFSHSLGKESAAPQGGIVNPRGPGVGGFGGGHYFGATGSKFQISLYHTFHFIDRVTIRDGILPIDLLDGGATGLRGGQPRNEFELAGSAVRHGIGVRFSGTWASATNVTSPDGLAAKTLRFGPVSQFNIRFFGFPAQWGHVAQRAPWLRGVRFLVAIDNVFDTYQRITDGNGATPFSYQRGYIDPLGRTIRVSIRKTFF